MVAGLPDFASVAAVVGMASLQLHGAYSKTAPSLQDLRDAAPGDTDILNKLNDADYLVGGLVLFIGIAFLALAKTVAPLVLLSIGFVVLSSWHHLVRKAA